MVAEINFIEFNKLSYLVYREQIIDLYFQAFTTGEYAQFLDRNFVVNTIDELINIGGGILALFADRPVGILIASPLFAHIEFPIIDSKDLLADNTIYINEVVVGVVGVATGTVAKAFFPTGGIVTVVAGADAPGTTGKIRVVVEYVEVELTNGQYTD